MMCRLDWIRAQPCCAPGNRRAFPRFGRVCAHHSTYDRALSRKTSNDQTMPLCCRHHGDFHGLTGAFKGWVRDQLRAWQSEQAARYQELWDKRAERERVAEQTGGQQP